VVVFVVLLLLLWRLLFIMPVSLPCTAMRAQRGAMRAG